MTRKVKKRKKNEGVQKVFGTPRFIRIPIGD